MLKSLEEHNQSRVVSPVEPKDWPTGIACPKCGKELYDVNPHWVLPGIPPQVDVKCLACEWTGLRYV